MLNCWQATVEKTECKDIGHVDREEHKLDWVDRQSKDYSLAEISLDV